MTNISEKLDQCIEEIRANKELNFVIDSDNCYWLNNLLPIFDNNYKVTNEGVIFERNVPIASIAEGHQDGFMHARYYLNDNLFREIIPIFWKKLPKDIIKYLFRFLVVNKITIQKKFVDNIFVVEHVCFGKK